MSPSTDDPLTTTEANTRDLISSLRYLSEKIIHPRNEIDLDTLHALARLRNALQDLLVGAKPALFDDFERQHWFGNENNTNPAGATSSGGYEAVCAFVFHLLRSASKRAEALAWLGEALRRWPLVDAGGHHITAQRIAGWADHFNRGFGSALGCLVFEDFRSAFGALINAPRSDLKTRRVHETVEMMLLNLAARGGGAAVIKRHGG